MANSSALVRVHPQFLFSRISLRSFVAILVCSFSSLTAQAQDNAVSKPVGFARITIPANSDALVSLPFDPLDTGIEAVFADQLTGASTITAADAIRKWDGLAYVNAYKADVPVNDKLWFSEFVNWTPSTMTFEPGEGFWIENRQSSEQTVYLRGSIVLDDALALTFQPANTLFGYPYSSAINIQDAGFFADGAHADTTPGDADGISAFDVESQSYIQYGLKSPDNFWCYTNDWSGSAVEDHLGLGQGFWYNRKPATGYDWTEDRPYADIFPDNNEPPHVTAMTINGAGDEMTLAIATIGGAGEKLDIYYKDLTEETAFTSVNWLIAETDISVNGQSSINWTDAGSVEPARGKINTVYARYYLIGRSDIDTDADGLPDSRETFVLGTNPQNADSDGDGMSDGWEIEHGFNPLSTPMSDVGGWWKLDETEGNLAYDSAATPHNGTISGAAHVAGELENALQFDGVNDEVAIDNNPAYKPAQLTVAAGVNFSALYGNTVAGNAPDGYMVILAQKNSGNGFAYAFYKTDRHSLVFEISSSSVSAKVETSDGFAVAGGWHNLVGTYDGSTAKLYINGEQIASTAAALTLDYDSSSGLMLGHCDLGGLLGDGYLVGVLDNVLVLTKALSLDEVTDLGEATADADGDGLNNYEEYKYGTNPHNHDTDGDDLSDYQEIRIYGTDPLKPDTDDDGLTDYEEVRVYGTDPNVPDTDMDVLSDGWEVYYGLDPLDVPPENLVGWWRLDETTGPTAADSSLYNHDGTLSGCAWSGEGRIYGALTFDGTDDSVSIANSGDYKPANALTVMTYVNFSSLYGNTVSGSAPDGYMVILAQKNASDGFAYAFYKTDRHSLVFEISSASGLARIETADGFAVADRGYHITGIYDGSQASFYVDGQLIASVPFSGNLNYDATSGLTFGHCDLGASRGDGHLAGILDEVRVYNIALTLAKITGTEFAALDSDNDGLANYLESQYGLDPFDPDTDDDDLLDGWEIEHFGNLDQTGTGDPDDDWRWNMEEYQYGTDPTVSDAETGVHFTITSDNLDARTSFQHVLSQITAQIGSPGRFHMSLGDISPPYDTYEDVSGEFGGWTKWFPVIGNHDISSQNDWSWIANKVSQTLTSSPILHNFGPSHGDTATYSFDCENAHFVVLDEYYDSGASPPDSDGDVNDELYNWLAADLAANQKPVTLVFGHEPALSEGGDSLGVHKADRDRFWTLLENHHVYAYFCGHTHEVSTTRRGGVWQINVGNAGQQPSLGLSFADVTVASDGQVTVDIWTESPGGAFVKSETIALPYGAVISEFMADNETTILDEDSEDSDWLEISNVGSEPLNLAGWHLTDGADNLTKWTFPNVTISGGGYLLVFASDKNRTDPGSELHTNFRLQEDGEYLALVEPDGFTIASEFAPEYPPHGNDISYGTDGATGELGYFDKNCGNTTMRPTPGAANGTILPSFFGLVVTEIMYHPGPGMDGDSEFIELQNVSGHTLDLGGVKFTAGVDYEFPQGKSLALGEYVVLTANMGDFAGAYGAGIAYAEYGTANKLDNGGERLTLMTAPDANGYRYTILNFDYQDDWYPSTDGGGSSLVIKDAYMHHYLWGSSASWRPSRTVNGTPDSDDGPAPKIVINEIMYNPMPGNLDQGEYENLYEYIELYNNDSQPVNLNGWSFDKGITYTFGDVTISAGGYLVIAADPAKFDQRYPGVSRVGPFTDGKLSNGGEKLRLVDQYESVIDEVNYCDQGPWAAVRKESTTYYPDINKSYSGWEWYAEHDGLGRSLELINPSLPNEYGEYWNTNTVAGGSPGAANSSVYVQQSDFNLLAPVITDVQHDLAIPTHSDAVTVTCRVRSEASGDMTVTLYYRVDADEPPVFNSISMSHDGDGIHSAEIPAQDDESVVEFYVEAYRDAAPSLIRAYPAPVQLDGGGFSQSANCLYQVLDNGSGYSGRRPVYYLIMTAAEREKLRDIGRDDERYIRINEQMNGTFISEDEDGVQIRYGVGVRNRGYTSRSDDYNGGINNYRVNFRHDEDWEGMTKLDINCRHPHLQMISSAIFQMADIQAQDASSVQLRVNGENPAESSNETENKTHGWHVAVEAFGGEYLDNHFPDDNKGALYTKNSGETPLDINDFEAETQDADNRAALSEMVNELKESGGQYGDYVLLDEWLRCIALDCLMVNTEGGLPTGSDEDYALYRGEEAGKFALIPKDLDSTMGNEDYDNSAIVNRDLLAGYSVAPLLAKLLADPVVKSRYYEIVYETIDSVFNSDRLDTVLDWQLEGILYRSEIAAMKAFIVARTNSVLSQLPKKGVIFVNGASSGPPTAPYWTEDTAFTSLQDAINAWGADSKEILVMPGTYGPINIGGKNVVIRSADPQNPAIITGDATHSAVTFNGSETSVCILSDLIIQQGNAEYGGGISGNHCTATIEWCVIQGNDATVGGGGLAYCDGNVFHNIVRGNRASQGGGIYECNGRIRNNLIDDNRADGSPARGGGLLCSGSAEIMNNTIVHNTAGSYGGVVLYGGLSLDGNATVKNCVIWANTANPSQVTGDDDDEFSNNLQSAPSFADEANHDYRLEPDSAAINAGDDETWMTDDVDLAHASRIIGPHVDIGAYEYVYGIETEYSTLTVNEGGAGTIKVKLTAQPHGEVTVTVGVVPGGDPSITVKNAPVTLAFSPEEGNHYWDNWQEVEVDAAWDDDRDVGAAVARCSSDGLPDADIFVTEIEVNKYMLCFLEPKDNISVANQYLHVAVWGETKHRNATVKVCAVQEGTPVAEIPSDAWLPTSRDGYVNYGWVVLSLGAEPTSNDVWAKMIDEFGRERNVRISVTCAAGGDPDPRSDDYDLDGIPKSMDPNDDDQHQRGPIIIDYPENGAM